MKKRHFLWTVIPLSILMLGQTKTDEKLPFLPYKKVLEDTAKGRQLAIKYCSTCHLFPEPNLLDKKTWTQSVLPNMAMRLGIREPGKNP